MKEMRPKQSHALIVSTLFLPKSPTSHTINIVTHVNRADNTYSITLGNDAEPSLASIKVVYLIFAVLRIIDAFNACHR